MTINKVALVADVGESFGNYTIGADDDLFDLITTSNIACGFHAGDPRVLDRTVAKCVQHGVELGAHPGYPDLVGFGRRNLVCTPDEVRDDVAYQIGAMKAFCSIHGVALQHVKPHGSLYNMSVGNESMIRAIVEAIAGVDKHVIYLALGGAQAPLVTRIANEAGIRVAFEAFPDRAYTPEGTLAPRSLAGAVIKDPKTAAERALRMAKEGKIVATDGSVLEMRIDTICVHGDNPSAVELVRGIRSAIEAEGISVVPMGSFIK